MFVSIIKKKGRPCSSPSENTYLKEKKENLFGNNSNVQYMNLVNIAYHSNKITKEERDVAMYLESLYFFMKKELGLKTIPKAAPNTWATKMKISYVASTKNHEKALVDWNNIKLFVQKVEPKISQDFFNLICSHHSYEELLALRINSQVMEVLKQGLACVTKMFYL